MKHRFFFVLILFFGVTFAQKKDSKPARQNAIQATINDQNILQIQVGATDLLTIEAFHNELPKRQLQSVQLKKDQTELQKKDAPQNLKTENFIIPDFKVIYEVVEFKLKIPGQPTQQFKGNQLDLSSFISHMKAGDTWYIFDVKCINPAEARSEILDDVSPVILELN